MVHSLKGKVEERKLVRPKNRVEGGRSGNGIKQIKLNNVSVTSEERTRSKINGLR